MSSALLQSLEDAVARIFPVDTTCLHPYQHPVHLSPVAWSGGCCCPHLPRTCSCPFSPPRSPLLRSPLLQGLEGAVAPYLPGGQDLCLPFLTPPFTSPLISPVAQGLEDAVARIFPVDKDMQDDMYDASEGLQEGSRFFVRICELPIDDPLRDLRYEGRCGEV